MIHCGHRPDQHTSTPDAAAAYERRQLPATDPVDRSELHPDDVLPCAIPLDAKWQGYLDASLVQVKALRAIAAGAS